MISSISFVILSILYNIILSFTFFYKSHIKSTEIKLYSYLLITNLIGMILEICCYFSLLYIGTNNYFSIFINRIFLFYYIIFSTLFANYFISISFSFENHKKQLKIVNFISMFVSLIAIALIIILPINFSVTEGVYSYGYAVNVVYIFMSILSILMFILFIIRYKHVNKKKYIPCITFLLGCSLVGIIQSMYPAITLSTPMEMLVLFIMYFTIENPDVKMIEQLEIAREQAEKANHAKTDFLSSMSHEIRTPLNAIVGFSQSLKEEDLPESAIEEVNDIIEASETLLDTVNGILDISKIEANKIEIIDSTYEFRKIFNELVALSKARLGEDRPIEFRYSMAEDIPKYLYGDYARVKQIILNFLTNAIKYTKEGYIDFSVNDITKNGICRLIIKVEDSGIGIKKQSINKLFDKFERLDNENSTIEGTGLGLAITKRLVELMHGKIIVQSIYGKGSQFMVILDQKVVDEADVPVVEDSNEKPLGDLSSKKVLIVDDNKLNLKVASRMLKQYNLNIEEVESGFECLNLIGGGNTYDLILMDDMMPKMSGKETFKKLKEDSTFNIPVVILTANAISGMKEQYLAEGFNDYLAKPIEKNELDRVIKKYLT